MVDRQVKLGSERKTLTGDMKSDGQMTSGGQTYDIRKIDIR